VVHNTALNSSDNLHFYPPDNHPSSDDVYWRGRGHNTIQTQNVSFSDNAQQHRQMDRHFVQSGDWLLIIIIIIIHEFRLTWRKVVKLRGHVTEKNKSRGVSWAQRTPEDSDFSRRQKSCSDVDVRTSSGRLFQTAAAAAANARSPIVECCVRRPTSAEVVAERSRCREPTSDNDNAVCLWRCAVRSAKKRQL